MSDVGEERTSIGRSGTSLVSQYETFDGTPRRHGFRCGAQLFSLFREESMERRLAAILVADVVRYSHLIGADGAHGRLGSSPTPNASASRWAGVRRVKRPHMAAC